LTNHVTISAAFRPIPNSIQDTEKELLVVFPNPVKDGQLTIDNGKLPINNIEIYDIMGKKQLSIINYQLSIIQIDISHLPNGMYIVKIGTSTGSVTGSVKIVNQ
jgi:hypothetical protein